MRKFTALFTLCFLFSSLASIAQPSKPDPFITIGPEISWPIFGAHNAGFGGAVKVSVPVNANGAFTVTASASHFKGKQLFYFGNNARSLNQTIIPARIGFRYNVYKSVYLEPQLGYSRVIYEDYNGSRPSGVGAFNNVIAAGIVLKNRWDMSARYEGNQSRSYQMNMVGVTFTYRLSLRK